MGPLLSPQLTQRINGVQQGHGYSRMAQQSMKTMKGIRTVTKGLKFNPITFTFFTIKSKFIQIDQFREKFGFKFDDSLAAESKARRTLSEANANNYQWLRMTAKALLFHVFYPWSCCATPYGHRFFQAPLDNCWNHNKSFKNIKLKSASLLLYISSASFITPANISRFRRDLLRPNIPLPGSSSPELACDGVLGLFVKYVSHLIS